MHRAVTAKGDQGHGAHRKLAAVIIWHIARLLRHNLRGVQPASAFVRGGNPLCINNDTGRNLGTQTDVGPRGAHASTQEHLLERAQRMEPPSVDIVATGLAYTVENNKLCSKCHDLSVLFSPRDTFRNGAESMHLRHVLQGKAACDTCHDPHASQSPHLINFDLAIVSGDIANYTRAGVSSGTCTLNCHTQQHSNTHYDATAAGMGPLQASH